MVIVTLAAAPPESNRAIGSLVELSWTVWLELLATGAGNAVVDALTVMLAVAAVEVPLALVAV